MVLFVFLGCVFGVVCPESSPLSHEIDFFENVCWKKRYFHQLFHVGSLLGPSVGALLTLWGSLWALLGVPGLSSDSGGLSVGVLSGRLFLCAGAVVRALGSLVGSL